ncbi:UNVERIFIED_CONTAM: hypothetical protein Sindi_1271800 [Sesamum indicum]
MNLQSPTTIKEVQKLTGKIACLNHFISQSADRSFPFFKILRKTKNFEWSEYCEKALQDLKSYLMKPLLLAYPTEGEILFLYLAVSENAISLVLAPEGVEIEIAARLSFPITNNEAEYEALILGLELAYEAGARHLEVFTDSQLVALQMEGTYETREKTMTLCREVAKSSMNKFDSCAIQQVPRIENDKADLLSKFGATTPALRIERL